MFFALKRSRTTDLRTFFAKLDQDLIELDSPFSKELPILRNKVWEIANKYGTNGPDIMRQYFEWKSQ